MKNMFNRPTRPTRRKTSVNNGGSPSQMKSPMGHTSGERMQPMEPDNKQKEVNMMFANISTQNKTLIKYCEELATEAATHTEILEEQNNKTTDVTLLLGQLLEAVKVINVSINQLTQLITEESDKNEN